MKKFIALITALSLFTLLLSCGQKKILTCDGCGKDVEVDASSEMTDEWTVFCSDCESELGLDSIIE